MEVAIQPITKNAPSQLKRDAVVAALEHGERSPKRLCEIAHIEQSRFMWFINRNEIQLPEDIELNRHNLQIDACIDNGLELTAIRKATGKTKASIRSYMINSNQQEIWKANKKRMRASRQAVVSEIYQHAKTKAYKQSAIHGRAFEYLFDLGRNVSFDVLDEIIRRYVTAVRFGYPMTADDLREGLSISKTYTYEFLNYVGLPPMCRRHNHKRSRIPGQEVTALKRGYDTHLSMQDIAYFVGTDITNVSRILRQVGEKKEEAEPIRVEFGPHLNYSAASQIFEADDADFTRDEITELVGKSRKVVDYVLDRVGHSIDYRIMLALETLYPDKDVTKPYITW